MPSFVFLFGNIIDSFNDYSNPNAASDAIKKVALIQTLIGIVIWITAYVYFTCSIMLSESVALKTKVAYLKAVLN